MHLKRLFCNSFRISWLYACTLLLYGLEACPLNKAAVNSLYFVINIFIKLFETNNIDIVRNCQKQFAFALPSVWGIYLHIGVSIFFSQVQAL